MITTFILSKDRAAQLDCLLNSLRRQKFSSNTIVLYKTSDNKFLEGYNLLKKYHDIEFILQSGNFYNEFFKALTKCSKYIFGLTDDTLFYRDCNFNYSELDFIFQYNTLCISMRMGINTVIQNIDGNERFEIPKEDEYLLWGHKFYRWDWTKKPPLTNPYYPVSLDGGIYRTEDIINMSKRIEFNNLREWEGNLIPEVCSNLKSLSKMVCPELSYCVNIPLNVVQPPNYPKIGPYGKTAKELNDSFLQGKRFSYLYSEEKIIGSHQYIEMREIL